MIDLVIFMSCALMVCSIMALFRPPTSTTANIECWSHFYHHIPLTPTYPRIFILHTHQKWKQNIAHPPLASNQVNFLLPLPSLLYPLTNSPSSSSMAAASTPRNSTLLSSHPPLPVHQHHSRNHYLMPDLSSQQHLLPGQLNTVAH